MINQQFCSLTRSPCILLEYHFVTSASVVSYIHFKFIIFKPLRKM